MNPRTKDENLAEDDDPFPEDDSDHRIDTRPDDEPTEQMEQQ